MDLLYLSAIEDLRKQHKLSGTQAQMLVEFYLRGRCLCQRMNGQMHTYRSLERRGFLRLIPRWSEEQQQAIRNRCEYLIRRAWDVVVRNTENPFQPISTAPGEPVRPVWELIVESLKDVQSVGGRIKQKHMVLSQEAIEIARALFETNSEFHQQTLLTFYRSQELQTAQWDREGDMWAAPELALELEELLPEHYTWTTEKAFEEMKRRENEVCFS